MSVIIKGERANPIGFSIESDVRWGAIMWNESNGLLYVLNTS